MITYSKLTGNGRLGNQLFQYATLRAIGIKNNLEIGFSSFPEKDFSGENTIFNLKVLNNDFKGNIFYCYLEKSFTFDEDVFKTTDNTDFIGYFQSWKYFNSIRDVLLKEFVPKDKSRILKVKDYINYINPHRNKICAIHIRRGDYLNNQNYHPICTKEYYLKAMSLDSIRDMEKIIVTDDKEWCRKNYPGFIISELTDNIEDLWLLKNCDAVVMANSSFSWWGAYLGKNEHVVAPKKWFGPEANLDSKDIYMNHWITI